MTAKDTPAAVEDRLKTNVEHTRAEMTTTLQALEKRLSPAELSAQLKVVLHDQIQEAKGAIHEEIQEAKAAIERTKESVKTDVENAIHRTKESVRAATIGRVEDIATKAGDAMNTAKNTFIDTVKENPIPAALAGIGIAWLLMNRSTAARQRMQGMEGRDIQVTRETNEPDPRGTLGTATHRLAQGAGNVIHQVEGGIQSATAAVTGAAQNAGHTVSDVVHQTGDAASRWAHDASDATGQVVHQAADAATQMTHRAQEMAGTAMHTARDQAMRIERGLEWTMQSNPIALGAVAFAAGAAVGYALPGTQQEDALMGPARDQLLHAATGMAHEAAQSIQHMAADAGSVAKKSLAAR